MTKAELQYNLPDYTKLLNKYNFGFGEKDNWLQVGNISYKNNWLLFLSVINFQTIEFLDTVLPILASKKVPFIIIKTPSLQRQLNIGLLGTKKIGKVITVFPRSNQELADLTDLLAPAIVKFQGPKVSGTLQVQKNIFLCYCELLADKNGKKHKLMSVPAKKNAPVNTKNIVVIRNKRKLILANKYLLTSRIRTSSKGNIYEATSLKRLSFKKCVIKEGKLNMVDDYAGRTIRDRLEWQKKVNEDLYGKIKVPKMLDFFDVNDDSYLVMEYISAYPLSKKIEELYSSRTWHDLHMHEKTDMLHYFLDTVKIVQVLHTNQYVHRDIKDGNLMVLPDGKPLLIDFELAYSIKDKFPIPPFGGVVPGYQAPEQLSTQAPTEKEDIYSLGGLLIFLLTGMTPEKFMDSEHKLIIESLHSKIGNDTNLPDIIIKCLDKDHTLRPSASHLIVMIEFETERMSNSSKGFNLKLHYSYAEY